MVGQRRDRTENSAFVAFGVVAAGHVGCSVVHMLQPSPTPSRPTRLTDDSVPLRGAPARAPDRASLDRALDRGVEALRGAQESTGAWKSDPDMGPVGLAITALVESWLGVLGDDDARRYAVSLVRAQREDGGFEIHPLADASSLGATATCRAALAVCGVEDTHRAVRRAERCIATLGGYEAVRAGLASRGEPTTLFCVMAGLLPATTLPPLSPDMAALPWSERMLDGRVHGGVPVILYACAAVRDRLAPTSVVPKFLRGPTRTLARTRLASFIGQFQCSNGSWNGMVFSTVFNLLALSGVGMGASDPMVRRGLDWIETRKQRRGKGVFVSVFDGEVWETAFALEALAVCGTPNEDDAILRGVDYLERAQCTEPQPRINQPRAGAPRTGGWAFQLGNHPMADCDDSGVVLAALGRCRSDTKGADPIARGVAWIEGMQNPSGGWPVYVHGLPDKPPGKPLYLSASIDLTSPTTLLSALVSPPPELGDPATADLCGRVLWGLGACGLTAENDTVRRAIEFLARDQNADGSWWGAWNPAYVATVSFALIGLATVSVDPKMPMLSRAIAWLLRAQNEDGGFGEDARSYADPSHAGRAKSTPPLTGIALRALAELNASRAATPRTRAAADRAAAYLVRTQGADGSWPNEGYLFTIIPPTFYVWGHHRLYYPLFGLGRHRQVSTARAPRTRAATRASTPPERATRKIAKSTSVRSARGVR